MASGQKRKTEELLSNETIIQTLTELGMNSTVDDFLAKMKEKGFGRSVVARAVRRALDRGVLTFDQKMRLQPVMKFNEECAYCGGSPKYVGDGHLSDWYVCTGCGWETPHYWDGAEYAISDWNEHMQAVTKEVEEYRAGMAKAMGVE